MEYEMVEISSASFEALVEACARASHEINRAYCKALGDNSQPEWGEAPDWQKDSARKGARLHLTTPNLSPSASHEAWLEEKRKAGWKYGQVKDPERKEHPCFVPYDELPIEERTKDFLFAAAVKAVSTVWKESVPRT